MAALLGQWLPTFWLEMLLLRRDVVRLTMHSIQRGQPLSSGLGPPPEAPAAPWSPTGHIRGQKWHKRDRQSQGERRPHWSWQRTEGGALLPAHPPPTPGTCAANMQERERGTNPCHIPSPGWSTSCTSLSRSHPSTSNSSSHGSNNPSGASSSGGNTSISPSSPNPGSVCSCPCLGFPVPSSTNTSPGQTIEVIFFQMAIWDRRLLLDLLQ